jgi:hypothetical protein
MVMDKVPVWEEIVNKNKPWDQSVYPKASANYFTHSADLQFSITFASAILI